MRVLVTGVSGFSGSFVARALAGAGHEVTGLNRRETRFLATLRGVEGVTLVCSDLAGAASLEGPFEAVVHAAATSPASGVGTGRMVGDNVLGTRSLIDAALGWRSRAFILFSSLSLYGSISTPVVDEATPIVNPDAYGATKHLSELMLAERQEELPGLALRLPGVLGPGAHRNWLSSIAGRLVRDAAIRAFHLDMPFNNAVHVIDIAAFILSLLERPLAGFEALVLGARGSIPVRHAIERLAAGVGARAMIEDVPAPKPAFTLCSEKAMAGWGYDPMEIGALIDRYAADVKAFGAGS